jgi:DNA-binding NarL/FixJ family response regulator
VDNNESQRQRLVDAIDKHPGLDCALASRRGEDAIEALAQNEAPQVVLMALDLPGMTGIEATRQIKGRSPISQIVALTAREDEDQIRELLCAGACGCLAQSPSDDQVVDAIEAARSNGAPMSPSVARTVLRLFRQHVRPRADYGLTPREREVLRLLVEDYTQKEIADTLFISPHTVDTHLRNLYRKLEVHSRTGAIVKALRERLL